MEDKITALGGRVLVKLAETEGDKVLASGIVLPASADENKKKEGSLGQVINVGPEVVESTKKELSRGDWVIFNKWAGTLATVEEEEYLLVKGEEILGRLNNVQ